MHRTLSAFVVAAALVGGFVVFGRDATASAGVAEPVTCVASNDGTFCMCRPAAEVCAGEHAVKTCGPARGAQGTCCLSADGCYCRPDATCTFEDEIRIERCDATSLPRGSF